MKTTVDCVCCVTVKELLNLEIMVSSAKICSMYTEPSFLYLETATLSLNTNEDKAHK